MCVCARARACVYVVVVLSAGGGARHHGCTFDMFYAWWLLSSACFMLRCHLSFLFSLRLSLVVFVLASQQLPLCLLSPRLPLASPWTSSQPTGTEQPAVVWLRQKGTGIAPMDANRRR